jgi:xanthine dehydrogenase accessory factor
MNDWLDDVARLRECNEPAIIVTVAATRGSVPRSSGTRMVVTAADVYGTIGGGHLEHQAIAIARDHLSNDSHEGALRRFPLGASLGQCCGGVVNLLFEPFTADSPWLGDALALRRGRVPFMIVSAVDEAKVARRAIVTTDAIFDAANLLDHDAVAVARQHLACGEGARLWRRDDRNEGAVLFFDPVAPCDFEIVLFGAGHVGRALVRVLAEVRCHVTWVDTREEEFPREIPAHVTVVCTDAPEAEVDAARPGSYFLVMTHSHPLDETIAERILRRDDVAYFGLIGSLAKRRQFEKRLEQRGTARARFARMNCPIGIPGIPGKEPATIAIAVAAELLQAHANHLAHSARAPASAQAASS